MDVQKTNAADITHTPIAAAAHRAQPLRGIERQRTQDHHGHPRDDIAPGEQPGVQSDQRRRRGEPGSQEDIGQMCPSEASVLGQELLLVPASQCLRVMARLFGGGDPWRRRDLVVAIPACGILFQRGDKLGQFVGKPVPWLPTDETPRRADVERIVVVGHVDHERPDEWLLALVERVRHDRFDGLLCPSAGLGQRLGHLDCRPVILAVDGLTHGVLDRIIAHRLGLADQQRELCRQLCTSVDDAAERVDHVVFVQHALTGRGVAGVERALHVALVDAGDLLGKRRHGRALVVQAGEVQQHDRNVTMLPADDLLSRSLRSWIGPFRLDRLAFVDPFAGSAGAMNQHRAGIDELADVEQLQGAQQAPRAFDVHGLVQGIVFAGEVEVGGKMNDAGDAGAVALPYFLEGSRDFLIRSEIGRYDGDALGSIPPLAVEADDAIVPLQGCSERGPQISGGAGDQDHGSGGWHVGLAFVPA